MGNHQLIRGNPEQKLLYVSADFSGGVNITHSDDLMQENELRYLENFDLEIKGELKARKGFGTNTALNEVLFNGVQTASTFPVIDRDKAAVKEIALIKIIRNDNNAWKNLADSSSLAEYQSYFGAENNVIKLFMLAKLADNTTRYYVNSYTIGASAVTRSVVTGILPFELTTVNQIVNIDTGAQYGTLYFTSNNYGMVAFNTEDNTFKYVGDFPSQTNTAYKPTGIEVRKVGFNVLGDDPLTWTDNSTLTTPSMQGLYLTTPSRIPLSVIPTGGTIQVNIIHTGTYHDFELVFSEYESPIDVTYTKNTTYSTSAITVYDVQFVTHPNSEVQINVNFVSTDVTLEDYIDYYRTGQIPGDAKPVETLNIGNYRMIQMYDRMVYYNDNELWFSEVNLFDYIPNYNYILVPLDAEDAIVKIKFFRTSYMLFTRKKIYKLVGSFESTTLSLDLVSDGVGCIAPESVQLVDNEMYFLSTLGLRALKTDRFIPNLENIRTFDEKVYPLITRSRKAVGLVYKEQYMLLSNDQVQDKTIDVYGRSYPAPDVLIHFYKHGTFAFNRWASNSYPRVLFEDAGDLYSIMCSPTTGGYIGEVFRYGDDYKDFGQPYGCTVETGSVHFGYPIHEKKIKNIIFKMDGNAIDNFIRVSVYGEGVLVHNRLLEMEHNDGYAEIEVSRVVLNKELMPTKSRNIAIRMTLDKCEGLTLYSMAYIYKLGKVRKT